MKTSLLFRLVKQSGFYALGNVAIKVSGLLLAPFLLDPTYLSLSEYGQLGVILILAQIAIQVGGLGLGTGLLRYVGKEELEKSNYAPVFTAFITSVFSSLLIYLLLTLTSEGISQMLLGDNTRAELIRYLGFYIGFKIIGAIPMMVIRIQERAGVYAATVIFEMIVLFGGIYYLLVVMQTGLWGIILAYSCASAVSVLIAAFVVLIGIRWRFDIKLVNALLRYGAPLVVVGLAGIILNAGDRFILQGLTTDEDVGMYEWAARMSGVLNLFVVQSFQLAFTVVGLKALSDGNTGFHKRIFKHYVVWAGWAALGVAILSYELTLFLNGLGASEHYLKSTQLVFPLVMGTLIYGIFIVVNNVLYSVQKTNLISRNVIYSALINVGLNFMLIPEFGALGAAISTLLSYSVLLLLTWSVANREKRIKYSWTLLVKVLVLVSFLYFWGLWVIQPQSMSSSVIRLLILLSYPLGVFLLGIYRTDEIRSGLQVVSEFLKSR